MIDGHVHIEAFSDLHRAHSHGVEKVRHMSGGPIALTASDLGGSELMPVHVDCSSDVVDGATRTPGAPGFWLASTYSALTDQQTAQAPHGCFAIKCYSSLSSSEHRAMADYATKRCLPLVGHVPHGMSWIDAIEHGQTGIEHLFGFRQSLSDTGSIRRFCNWAESADRRNVAICPTISPQLRNRRRPGRLDAVRVVLSAMRTAGATILPGTDWPLSDAQHAVHLRNEYELLAEWGLIDPIEAGRHDQVTALPELRWQVLLTATDIEETVVSGDDRWSTTISTCPALGFRQLSTSYSFAGTCIVTVDVVRKGEGLTQTWQTASGRCRQDVRSIPADASCAAFHAHSLGHLLWALKYERPADLVVEPSLDAFSFRVSGNSSRATPGTVTLPNRFFAKAQEKAVIRRFTQHASQHFRVDYENKATCYLVPTDGSI